MDDDVESQGVRLRAGKIRSVFNIFSAGSMIGTALLYPMAHAGGLGLKAVVLAIWILATLIFHALNLAPYLSYGRYILPFALLALLLAIVSAGSSRKDLIPWVPVFVVFTSISTIVVHEVVRRLHSQWAFRLATDADSGVADESGSEHTFRTRFERQAWPSSQSNRMDPRLFRYFPGPSSFYSGDNESRSSHLTLADVRAQPQSYWTPQIWRFFADEATTPYAPGPSTPRMASPSDGELDLDPPASPPRVSEDTSIGSDVPLLHQEV